MSFGDEERRTFLSYIASESQRLTVIVDALLNVARLDTGDLQVNLAPTDVRDVVGQVVQLAPREPEIRIAAGDIKAEKSTSDLVTMLSNGALTPPAIVRYALKDFQEAVRLADGEAGQQKVLLDFSERSVESP